MERSFKKEVESLKLGDGDDLPRRRHPRGHQGAAAIRRELCRRLPGRAGVASARRDGRGRGPARRARRACRDLHQRGLGRGHARRLDQLSAARRGHLEVDRRHQRRGRRALQPRLARRDRRRDDHPRRGLRRRRERHPGALLRLCAEIVDVAARSAARPAHHRAHGREGLRAVGGEPRAGDDGAAHPRLPRHRRVRGQGQHARRRSPAATASPARRASNTRGWRIRRRCSCRSGCKVEERLPAALRLHPRAQAQRVHPRRSRRHRHHRLRRADQRRAARAGAARPRRRSTARRACRSTCSTASIRWCRRRCATSAPASARCWWSRKARPTTSSSRSTSNCAAPTSRPASSARARCRRPANTPRTSCSTAWPPSCARRARPASTPTPSPRACSRCSAHKPAAAASLGDLPPRPPTFCTGCPERPVFSAIKLMQRELGPTHISAPTSAAMRSRPSRRSAWAIRSSATACRSRAPPAVDAQSRPAARSRSWATAASGTTA